MTITSESLFSDNPKHAAVLDGYRSLFDTSIEHEVFSHDPSWLRNLRRDALAHFTKLGFPLKRRGNEAWKYTDVSGIAAEEFPIPTWATCPPLTRADVEPHAFAGSQLSRLVFANGRLVDDLSSIQALPKDVIMGNLRDGLSQHESTVATYFSKQSDYPSNAFTALNTTFFRDGVFLVIPDGVETTPIQIMFLSTGGQPNFGCHPRILIILGKDAKTTLIETYASGGEGRYLTNSVSEIYLGKHSSLTHLKVQKESEQAFHISSTLVTQDEDSSYFSLLVDIGGRLVRNNLSVKLDGQGASANLNGLYLLTRDQHVDYSTFIDHVVPNTHSAELYKGVLGGKAHAVFGGKMLIRPGAQKITSYQTNKTLLLSEGSGVDTKPQLEIYADDVKCGHGAAIGQIDPEALFYLKTRGLDDEQANEMLTAGFTSEVIQSIKHIPLRAYFEQFINVQLHKLQG